MKIDGNIGTLDIRLPEGMTHVQLEDRLSKNVGRCAVTPCRVEGEDVYTVGVRLDQMSGATTEDLKHLLVALGCEIVWK